MYLRQFCIQSCIYTLFGERRHTPSQLGGSTQAATPFHSSCDTVALKLRHRSTVASTLLRSSVDTVTEHLEEVEVPRVAFRQASRVVAREAM